MIYCRTLGPVEVSVDQAPAPPELLWKKNLALLLYLARASTHRCTRDHAIGLLWSEKDESAARHSLREAVRVLRRLAGESQVKAEGDQIQLVDGTIELDTDRFDHLAKAGDWAGAARLVAGEFLEGFSVPDASPFEDWLTAERLQWRMRAIDALVRCAEQRLAAGDTAGAEEPARRALKLEPLSDRAVRTLMRGLALAGDRSAALDLFAHFSASAKKERDGHIDPETEALANRLRAAREWHLPQEALSDGGGVDWKRAPLVGRERELSAILEQWREAASGRLGMVVIEADAGAGKTRLAEEVIARVALEGGTCLSMRAVAADLDHPLSAVLGLARGGLLDAPGVAGTHPSALAALTGQITEWAERFPKAARDEDPWKPGPALSEILRATSVERPVLMIIDDAHWVDEPSYEVLEAIARDLAGAPILILFGTSSEPSASKLGELRTRIGRDIPGISVSLSALGADSLRALAHWALPSYSAEEADRLARRIGADSAGLPLLAVEICHAVAAGLDLNATSGAWPQPLRTLDQTLPGELPDTMVAAIRVGFRRLSREAQAALTATAVLGDRVEAQLIGRATGLEGQALNAALDELEWRRWLVAEPRGYAFVARIVREVVERDMITAGQRQRIVEAVDRP
ncbi:MAG: AAA family ATPase [Gemmatimonadetes bacterium]|nr:AAA family ATPase [Gemmatimonadota bacterium]